MNKLIINGKEVTESLITITGNISSGEPDLSPTEPWKSYPEGAIWVDGNKSMKVIDGEPKQHSVLVYFNYMKWPDVIDADRPLTHAYSDLRRFAGYEEATKDLTGSLEYLDAYITETLSLGFNAITLLIANTWFTSGGFMAYDRVKWADEPSSMTFKCIERIRKRCVERGVSLHLWWWGDDERHWTPTGIKGGLNGWLDGQLQHEFSEYFGDKGGLTMSYGFDLQEPVNQPPYWVTAEQCGQWARRVKSKFTYPLAIGARGYDHPELTYMSYAGTELDQRPATTKPQFHEERYHLGRWGRWTTEDTKRWRDNYKQMGISCMFGIFYGQKWNGEPAFEYPNKEILMDA